MYIKADELEKNTEKKVKCSQITFSSSFSNLCPDSMTPGILFGYPLCLYKQNISGI